MTHTALTALAAGALALGAAAPAGAATARISPVHVGHSTIEGRITVWAAPRDACRMLFDHVIMEAPYGARARVIWHGRRIPVTACQRTFEDGWATGQVYGRWPRSILRRGQRYYLGVRLWSRGRPGGSRWSSHTFVRSFWAPR